MREISPEEAAFIEATLEERESVVPVRSKQERKKRARQGRKRPWQRVSFWAVGVMLIPTFLSALFLVNLMRVESLLGTKTVEVLTKQPLPASFEEKAASQGYEWVPQYIELYKHKELIILGLFTAGIVVVMMMFLIEALIKRSRQRKYHAEADSLEDS